MADAKITDLTALTTLSLSDLFAVVDVANSQTKKVTFQTLIDELLADQSEQEGASDDNHFVTPLYQHFHPSAAKAWGKVGVAGGSPDASYNIASITDGGTGIVTFTIATDFSSAHWAYSVSIENIDASIDASTDVQIPMVGLAGQAAGSLQIICGNASGSAAVDPTKWSFIGFGDHA